MPGTRATIGQMNNFLNKNVRLAFVKGQSREAFVASFVEKLRPKMGELYDDYQKRVINAETRGNKWLADGNAAAEAGNKKRADYCYAKGQVWLDRYNRLVGNS